MSAARDASLTIDMLSPELDEHLRQAGQALETATSENIVELCKQYLALLDECRGELYKLAGTPVVQSRMGSPSPEEVKQNRKEVRSAIEHTTRERNRVEALLLSFTSVSGYTAVEVFNRLKYKGHDDRELRAGGVARFNGGIARESMSVQEAVDAAGLLLRDEYIARQGHL